MKRRWTFPVCTRILIEMDTGQKVDLHGKQAREAFFALQRLARLPEVFEAGLNGIAEALKGADRKPREPKEGSA